jgi:hypothetical protein
VALPCAMRNGPTNLVSIEVALIGATNNIQRYVERLGLRSGRPRLAESHGISLYPNNPLRLLTKTRNRYVIAIAEVKPYAHLQRTPAPRFLETRTWA